MEKNINNYIKENKKNYKKNQFNINNLFEVEHFLSSLRKTSKWIELYKLLK